MAIQRITWSEKYRRATLHHWGCNFRCIGCSYLLKEPPRPPRAPRLEQVFSAMRSLEGCESAHFMGGEPTLNKQLPELLRFCKQELGLTTRLGHTTGWNLVTENLDGANVTIKAIDEEKHIAYTGHPGQRIRRHFQTYYDNGLELRASSVLIPGFIDLDELEKVVGFIAGIDRTIPFHLMGFIPVPGAPYRRPTDEEMAEAVALCESYLETVGSSHLTPEQLLDSSARDDRFVIQQVL